MRQSDLPQTYHEPTSVGQAMHQCEEGLGGGGSHQSEIRSGSGEFRIFFLDSEWTMMVPLRPSRYCALKCEWYLGVKH